MAAVKFRETGLTDKREIERLLREEGYEVYEWYDPPGAYYPVHTHPGREVRWVIEGEVVIGTQEGEFLLKEGDMIELEPEVPHWARTEKGVRYLCGTK